MSFRIYAICGVCLASALDASAEESEQQIIEEIVVIAHPLSAEGLAQAAIVLEGQDLQRALGGTLGETLVHQPGIHSASFGQAVGRPVIHGLGGARVRVMEDRIDAMDASVTSPDHTTTIEPFIADRIEVLKGPSTLVYGNGAIGGVVDVHTGRIPHRVPDRLEGRMELRGADNADQRTAAGVLGAGIGSFALQADAFYRDADDYDIPGFVDSAQLRALEEVEGGESEEAISGRLPGSALENKGGALGVAFVGDNAFAGLSLSRFDANYGLPGGHSHEDEGDEAEGDVTLDLEQTRVDFEAGFDAPFNGAESVNLRVGYNDYQHKEIEPSGETGTVFDNEALDGRIEIVHQAIAGFEGAVGMQYTHRDFSAVGEEAFVPPVKTDIFGLFWVGERKFEALDLETGLRYEHVAHDPESVGSRSFDLLAASLGIVVPFADTWSVGAVLDYSARAPVAEELFSNGPHLATGSFEIGDANLDEERVAGISATLKHVGAHSSLTLTAYYTAFDEFIYQSPTGEDADDLPVQQWTQDDAAFYGIDLEGSYTLIEWESGAFQVHGAYDYVRGRLDEGRDRDLPRIPPHRYNAGFGLDWRIFSAALDYTYVSKQDSVAALELPTHSYEDLRVHLGARMPSGEREFEVFLQGRNLTDDEQRYHASFIKDFAPQPGRTLEAGVRVTL